jgi:opacity protein-like surface antigen
LKHKMAAAGIVLLLAAVLSAADASGKWKGSFETPEGSATLVFDLKTAGDVLSGTVSGLAKPAEIKDGKVQGDVITFSFVTEYQGNPLKLLMRGQVNGEEIKFNIGTEDGGWGTEFVAKKG